MMLNSFTLLHCLEQFIQESCTPLSVRSNYTWNFVIKKNSTFPIVHSVFSIIIIWECDCARRKTLVYHHTFYSRGDKNIASHWTKQQPIKRVRCIAGANVRTTRLRRRDAGSMCKVDQMSHFWEEQKKKETEWEKSKKTMRSALNCSNHCFIWVLWK